MNTPSPHGEGPSSVISGGAPSAPKPAAPRSSDPHSHNALPAGTRLGEFEVTDLVGEGGFGIVYLAFDHTLQRAVAIKEYMPSSLVERTDQATVRALSRRTVEAFEKGLASFINEARLLAQFDHPSLVKVYRFWEANGTAYMAMPFYDGVSLRDTLRQMDAPPDEAWLLHLLDQVLEALAIVHKAQCYHRDIAPDNIIMLPGDRPVLLDFGAARRVVGEATQALTVILKPGYAPIEQYADATPMRQGAWTDIYALGAVVHYAIHRKAPPVSVGRLFSDPMEPLVKSAAGRYSRAFLEVIDRTLAVRSEDRPQSVDELRHLLGLSAAGRIGRSPPPRPEPVPPPAPDDATRLIDKRFDQNHTILLQDEGYDEAFTLSPTGETVMPSPTGETVLRPAAGEAPTHALFDEPFTLSPTGEGSAPDTRISLAAPPETPRPPTPPPRAEAAAPQAAPQPAAAKPIAPTPAPAAPARTGLMVGAVLALIVLAIIGYVATRSSPPAAPEAKPALPAQTAPLAPAAPEAPTPPPTPITPEAPTATPARPAEPSPPPKAETETKTRSKPESKPLEPKPEAARPTREAAKPPRSAEPAEAEATSAKAKPSAARSGRCSDLLQRASLGEVLSPDEDHMLKKECK